MAKEEELEDLLNKLKEESNELEEEVEHIEPVEEVPQLVFGGEHLEATTLDQEFDADESVPNLESIAPVKNETSQEAPAPYEISSPYEIQDSTKNDDVRYAQISSVTAPILDNLNSRDLQRSADRDLFVERDSNLRGGSGNDELEAFEKQQKKYEMERQEEGLPFRREKRDRDISFI